MVGIFHAVQSYLVSYSLFLLFSRFVSILSLDSALFSLLSLYLALSSATSFSSSHTHSLFSTATHLLPFNVFPSQKRLFQVAVSSPFPASSDFHSVPSVHHFYYISSPLASYYSDTLEKSFSLLACRNIVACPEKFALTYTQKPCAPPVLTSARQS
jgi:hypothetical protein